jgi:hypothetical protein
MLRSDRTPRPHSIRDGKLAPMKNQMPACDESSRKAISPSRVILTSMPGAPAAGFKGLTVKPTAYDSAGPADR